MELCSMLFGNLGGRGIWGRMDICICIAEFLHCSLEAITRLLIGIAAAAAKSLQSCPTLYDPIDWTMQPTRLPRPWDSPGKNTGVGCHFLLQYMKVKSKNEVAQSCPTLCNPMDCSLPGFSIHGIFQTRVLEWDAIASSNYQINDMNLNKLWEIVEDRGAWNAAVHGVTKCQT